MNSQSFKTEGPQDVRLIQPMIQGAVQYITILDA